MKTKKMGFALLKIVLVVVMVYAIVFGLYKLFMKKEGFELGSSLDYKMGDGVSSSWENNSNVSNKPYNIYQSLEDNVGGRVPLPEGELLIFNENKFDPKCCPSAYSNSTGCVCATPEQMNYLNQRGGNRTMSSMY
jgi:hypothetical protein